jgi:arylformamidase
VKINRIIDLSQPLRSDEYSNPGLPMVLINITATHDKDGWMAETVYTGLHAGTHIDAPAHKLKNGKTISDYPLERFQGDSVVIDLYDKKPGSEILIDDLYPYSKKISEGDNILLCTGWGLKKNGGDKDEYIYNSPWLGAKACRFLIEKKVNAVGIDHFSIGGLKSENVAVPHDLLLSADILIFEDLMLPKLLLEKEKWYIAAFPVFLGSTSGSFARIVAIDFK